METSSFFRPLTPPGAPFSGTPSSGLRQSKKAHLTTMAFKKDGYDGKIVDENMIVLRERIREMEAAAPETEGGGGRRRLQENWMEWEKRYVEDGGYWSDIYEAVALLQRFLMESRPSVAVGLVAGFAFSGSTAAMVVFWWLINFIHGN